MHEDIKGYVFEALPGGPGKWIVVAWGKIVNERTGSYEQEIVLRRYSEEEGPSKTWDLRDTSKLFFCKVNLGSLRILSPGTVIQNQKIVHFVHEYLEKREIRIENPQSLLKKPFRILYDPIFPQWERNHLTSSVDKIETRLLEGARLNVLIPCSVIADYYYYGMTYLIKAIMEGKLSSKFRNANDVYNPKTLSRKEAPNGKVVVRVELQKRMSYKDKFKIARLAHDYYFRSKCLDIYTGIVQGNNFESYIDTDLPVNEPVTLSVYGVEVSNKHENFFLVHSIAKCSAKPPFDLIIAGKKFAGKSHYEDNENGSGEQGDPNDESLGFLPKKQNSKKRSKTKLEKGDEKIIGGGKAPWNSDAEDIPYNRDQQNNFPDDAAINEKDFIDPEKRERLEEILRKFGFAGGLTTNPDKKGATSNLQLGLFATGPVKPKPTPPTQAFQNIEELMVLVEESLKGRLYQASSRIRCPVAEGIDKYSAFPVADLMDEKKPELQQRQYLNFCFMNVREKYHTQHRRVYINEMIVNGHAFYVMDIEPKYKVENDKNEIEKFVSSFGVIFYTNNSTLKDDSIRKILKLIVTTYKTPSGQWKFLERDFGYRFLCVEHRRDQVSFDKVSGFILQACDRKSAA